MTDFLDGSPVVVHLDGVTFNGIDDNGVKWTIESLSGWDDGPSVDVEQTQRIVSHGQFAQPGHRGGRTITMSGALQSRTHGHLKAAVGRLATVLADGGFATFEVVDAEHTTQWAPVQLLHTPDVSWDDDPLTVKYQLSLLAPSAYKYGVISEASTAFSTPASGTTTAAEDAFTRVDNASSMGSATTGGAWTAQAGTWGINTNRGYCATGVSVDYATAVLTTAASDCTVEATLQTVHASGNTGIVVRSNSSTTGFAVLADGMWDIGTDGAVGGSYGANFASGDRMRVVMSGPNIEVFRQVGAVGAWTSVHSVSNTSYQSNTKHGLTIWDTAANSSRFDNFLITTGEATGLVFPLMDGSLDFGALTDVGQAAVTNHGSAAAPVVFTITGPTPTAGFVITDTTTDARIEYLGQVPSGSELVIDAGAGSVIIDGTADRLGDTIVSAWPTIAPGETRAFLFEPNGSGTAAELTVEVTATYW